MSTSAFPCRWWWNHHLHLVPRLFISAKNRGLIIGIIMTGALRRLRRRPGFITDPVIGIVMTMAGMIMAMAVTVAETESRLA